VCEASEKLLRLPGMQPFGQVRYPLPVTRRGELLRKHRGIACHIERLGGDHSRSLVVAVILSGDIQWQPRHDHFRTRQPHQPHSLCQCRAMVPGLERPQHILARRIRSAEEPHIHHAERRQRAPRLNLALGAQRGGLFEAHGVAAAIAARSEDHGHAPVVLVNGPGQVAGHLGLVVGMRDDHQDVGLEAFVGLRRRRRLGQLAGHQPGAHT